MYARISEFGRNYVCVRYSTYFRGLGTDIFEYMQGICTYANILTNYHYGYCLTNATTIYYKRRETQSYLEFKWTPLIRFMVMIN
jgi:hypothetical protein